jgi:hypothetical protein
MISVIISLNDKDMLNSFFMPTFLQTQNILSHYNLPEMELVFVQGSESIFRNYAKGQAQAKFPIKAYIHQDVNLMEPNWIFKVLSAFADNPDYGLFGFVGTTQLLPRGMWWESGREYIRGELWSGKEKADWQFSPVTTVTEVELVDSFFMVSNRHIPFNEKARGFHLADAETCRIVRRQGYKIGVIPHKAWHIGAIRTSEGVKELQEEYYQRWGL